MPVSGVFPRRRPPSRGDTPGFGPSAAHLHLLPRALKTEGSGSPRCDIGVRLAKRPAIHVFRTFEDTHLSDLDRIVYLIIDPLLWDRTHGSKWHISSCGDNYLRSHRRELDVIEGVLERRMETAIDWSEIKRMQEITNYFRDRWNIVVLLRGSITKLKY
jgi:hypothetical protein